MCVKGWKNPLYNPAGIKVITREFQHQVGPPLDLRGGENTADHVDILGNYELTVKKKILLCWYLLFSNYHY